MPAKEKNKEEAPRAARFKPFAPKIVHKGLALVITPILLESLFFFQLYDLIERADKLAMAERRQTTVVDHLNWLMSDLATVSGNVATYLSTGNRSYDIAGKQARLKMQREFSEIEGLVGEDQNMRKVIGKMRKITEEQFERFQKLRPSGDENVSIQDLLRLKDMRPFIKEAGMNNNLITAMLKEQRAYLEEVRLKEAQSREKVKEIVFYGILGNFFGAIILVLVFLRDITVRLGILVDNAKRLPRGEELPRRVGGSDELSYLDNVLHDAAQELKDAQEDRNSIMEMVAHDLRSPLMSSQVALDLLVKDKQTVLGSSGNRHVETVKRNITRLVSLVNDLLTVEKLEAGKLELELEAIEMKSVIDEALLGVGGLAQQKNITLSNDSITQGVTADRSRIVQLLINYLSNAIKFSPKDSTISIYSGRQKGFLVVSVQDEGPGISQEEQERLFSKFYQSKEGKRSKGFGLGLAICKLIAESHGGTVGVESRPKEGSRFWFSLPI